MFDDASKSGYTMSMKDVQFFKAQIMTVARTDKGTAVLVRPIDEERAVPIFIGQLEAHSILIGIGKIPMPRPLTHDLLLQILEHSKFSIEKVEIYDLKEGTFYARIVLKQGVKRIELDARPSDALALISRTGSELYIAKMIVDEVGIPVNLISEEPHEEDLAAFLDEVDEDSSVISDIEIGDDPVYKRITLLHQLEEAVQSEEYEEAARLRDSIRNLDDSFPDP